MKKNYDCGIDLGTTNSCMAISTDGVSAEIIESTTDGLSTTPSAVYISKNGKMMIGQSAYQQPDRKNVALQFKRLMGTNEKISFKSSGTEMTPEELSAEVLKKLRQDYAARNGKDATDAVITIPAAFTSMQNEATVKAAKLAGFSNAILLQEPIAASIAYGIRPDAADKYWMVFDYGGGTLDVAIVSTINGRLKVINTEGDNFFGGCDVDAEVLERIVLPQLRKEYAISDPVRADLRNRLLLEVENAKKSLGTKDSVSILISGIFDDEMEEIEFDYDMTRAEFDAAIKDTVIKSIEIAKKALKDSRVEVSALEKIILVGGSTYIELVRTMLRDTFQIPVDCSVNPMHAVAIGAGVYAQNNYFDLEEEETKLEAGAVSVKCTYVPQSEKDKVPFMCNFTNAPEGASASVRTTGWDSGYMNLTNGALRVQVPLLSDGKNHFVISLFDSFKQPVSCAGDVEVDIIKKEQAIKISGAPMAHSVCVGAMRDGYEVLSVVLEKNMVLPAANTVKYTLGKTILKGSKEGVSFNIYEGEVYDNPMANAIAGTICIDGESLTNDVHVGTDVSIKVLVDENRIIHVKGVFEETGEEIAEQQLLKKENLDIESRFFDLEDLIEGITVSIRNIGNRNMDYAKEQQETFERIQKDYAHYVELYDDGKEPDSNTVYKFIERFYDFQTAIIRAERYFAREGMENYLQSRINNVLNQAEHYGSVEVIARTKDAVNQISQIQNREQAHNAMRDLEQTLDRELRQNPNYLVSLVKVGSNRAKRYGVADMPEYIEKSKMMEDLINQANWDILRESVDSFNMLPWDLLNHDPFRKARYEFGELSYNTGLDFENRNVKMLMEKAEQAIREEDTDALVMAVSHLTQISKQSANEMAGNRHSDLNA